MNRLSSFVLAVVLLTFLLAPQSKATAPISTQELVGWCSIEKSEDIDEDLDRLSCLMFLQGVLSGVDTAVVAVSDEYWAAGFEGAVTQPRFYCLNNAPMGEIRKAILPHLTKAPQEEPGDAVLWSLKRAFPCAYNDFWHPGF